MALTTEPAIAQAALEAARAKPAPDYTEHDRSIYARGYGDRLRRTVRLPYGGLSIGSNAAYHQGWEDASVTLPDDAY